MCCQLCLFTNTTHCIGASSFALTDVALAPANRLPTMPSTSAGRRAHLPWRRHPRAGKAKAKKLQAARHRCNRPNATDDARVLAALFSCPSTSICHVSPLNTRTLVRSRTARRWALQTASFVTSSTRSMTCASIDDFTPPRRCISKAGSARRLE